MTMPRAFNSYVEKNLLVDEIFSKVEFDIFIEISPGPGSLEVLFKTSVTRIDPLRSKKGI